MRGVAACGNSIPWQSGAASQDRKASDRSLGVTGSLTLWAVRVVIAWEEDLFHFSGTHGLIPARLRRDEAARAAKDGSASALGIQIGSHFVPILRGWLGGFFGFTGGDFGLQCAVFGAAVDFLFAQAVEARGVATCFGHNLLFS
jgi:hypothetical protein